jgi:hypothetical protein
MLATTLPLNSARSAPVRAKVLVRSSNLELCLCCVAWEVVGIDPWPRFSGLALSGTEEILCRVSVPTGGPLTGSILLAWLVVQKSSRASREPSCYFLTSLRTDLHQGFWDVVIVLHPFDCFVVNWSCAADFSVPSQGNVDVVVGSDQQLT